MQLGQHAAPGHTVFHLSDTHFVGTADGETLYDVIDAEANFERAVERFSQTYQAPEAIVFTGDLADRGRVDAYERLRAAVEPVAERLGAPVIWVMGNHDSRPNFRRALLDAEPSMAPVDAVYDINGLRIIALDSTIPGSHRGEISEEQYAWLADVLATPAPDGTLLALHHPPIPSSHPIHALVELGEQSVLEDAIRGTDVRGVLGGHLHYSTMSTFAGGIPVSVAGSTCYTADSGAPGSQSIDGAQSFTMVEVYADRVVNTVVPIGAWAAFHSSTREEFDAFQRLSREEMEAYLIRDPAHYPDEQPFLTASVPAL